jgi:16S rRNA (uracil1498-N3)-methyltransferase
VAKGDRLDRMERVCAGTLAQCGRAAGPTLRGPLRLIDALDALPADIERRICLPGAEDPPAPAGPAAVLIGPEGGWTPAEVQAALARGCQPMSLGPTVLRAETAVAAALARLYSGAAGDTAT